MNAQYVTSRGLGKFLTKYAVKPEPTRIFNVTDGDKYREHIIARHLDSMECIFFTTSGKNMQFVYCSKYLSMYGDA